MESHISNQTVSDPRADAQDLPVSVAILIASCDAYSDLWIPFAKSLDRYWPDCPWPRYLLTNFKTAPEGIATLAIGADTTWSRNLILALDRIDAEYVLLTVDDLILCAPVQTSTIVSEARWAAAHGVAAVQMARREPLWNLLRALTGGHPASISAGSTYRASTVFTLWNRAFLRQLLNPAENAWQFELQASERVQDSVSVCLSARPRFRFVNSVIKGKLTRTALRTFASQGYPVSATRAVMTASDQRRYNMIFLRSWLFKLVPPGFRQGLRRILQNGATS